MLIYPGSMQLCSPPMYWDRRGGVVALILVYFSHVYKHGDGAGDCMRSWDAYLQSLKRDSDIKEMYTCSALSWFMKEFLTLD